MKLGTTFSQAFSLPLNMTDSNEPSDRQVREMRAGNQQALAEVFSLYTQRLRQIIRFRLDYRLANRISDSDVLQESFIAAARRLEHFETQADMPAFLWLRLITQQQLVDLHRQHLQAEMRDVRKEVSLPGHSPSPHTSLAIAAQLAGRNTAVSEVMSRGERIEKLEAALNQMDEIDREVIALRHFEELSNIETAKVLNIETSAASKRYLRAMRRLADLMQDFADENGGA
ncbi:sigma-70 family RNA polymerase sigma factor [Planctomycetes bacterium K23_9]|uniref:ECF RNA polymerase sigma factor SigW n=1 Tax=Stieleria marina TaxID=1930275 RepID=A0A517NN02_9BACT|nr:ECF RNA polymerase sigma factor SigW [Planctomycetes bacterium K23_9]